MENPEAQFRSPTFLAINKARLNHLDSLGFFFKGRRVLELGSGIGDITEWLLQKRALVTAVEAREENVAFFEQRFPRVPVFRIDLNCPNFGLEWERFDLVICYGLLYHLRKPMVALDWASQLCRGVLLVETCVTSEREDTLSYVIEKDSLTQAVDGVGCRPTRAWVLRELRCRFSYAYVSRKQPAHEEFPVRWDLPLGDGLTRSVFAGSRVPLSPDLFSRELLEEQEAER